MVVQSETALLSQLKVNSGPHELMSRFFLKAIQSLVDRGISLHLATFAELEKVNSENKESWRPLFPSFSPSVGGVGDNCGYAIFGVDHMGDVVATQAVRIFEWQKTNLKCEAEALRLFYEDPGRARPGESCEVTASIAPSITGRVSLGGAIWYHPDFRGMQLAELMTRVNRAYAYVTYNVDQHIGFLAPESVARRIHTRAGFREVDEAMIMKNSTSYPDKDVSMMVLRAWPNDIIDDAFLYLSHWRSKLK